MIIIFRSNTHFYIEFPPTFSRTFVAELNFFVKSLGRAIHGRDSGSNKQTASKSCALSIIRQLYHLGVIEAFSGTLKKERSVNEMKPFDVKLSPNLIAQIDDCLNSMDIRPVQVPPQYHNNDGDKQSSNESVSLMTTPILNNYSVDVKPTTAGVVPWSPPQPNWNPWTNCNIDEGPLATATLEQLSEQLLEETKHNLNNNRDLQNKITARQSLHVYSAKNLIMEAINDNPVIIIKGSTGCGK